MFWVSYNSAYAKEELLFMLSSYATYPPELVVSAAVAQQLEKFFNNAKDAYIVFGDDLNAILYFHVRKKAFLDLDSALSYLWKAVLTLPEQRLFATYIMQTLHSLQFTHARFKKPIVRDGFMSELINAIVVSFREEPVVAIVDSKSRIDIEPRAVTPLPPIIYDVVLYWNNAIIPARWRSAEDATLQEKDTEIPSHNEPGQKFFYYKHLLDYWREEYGIPEGRDSLVWREDEEGQISNLTNYYHLTFTRMIVDKPGLSPEAIAWIQNTKDKMSHVEYNAHKAKLIALYWDYSMYFATNFNSKYAFLFAHAQFWRLFHWLSLTSRS